MIHSNEENISLNTSSSFEMIDNSESKEAVTTSQLNGDNNSLELSSRLDYPVWTKRHCPTLPNFNSLTNKRIEMINLPLSKAFPPTPTNRNLIIDALKALISNKDEQKDFNFNHKKDIIIIDKSITKNTEKRIDDLEKQLKKMKKLINQNCQTSTATKTTLPIEQIKSSKVDQKFKNKINSDEGFDEESCHDYNCFNKRQRSVSTSRKPCEQPKSVLRSKSMIPKAVKTNNQFNHYRLNLKSIPFVVGKVKQFFISFLN
jgi:hypothetical protein